MEESSSAGEAEEETGVGGGWMVYSRGGIVPVTRSLVVLVSAASKLFFLPSRPLSLPLSLPDHVVPATLRLQPGPYRSVTGLECNPRGRLNCTINCTLRARYATVSSAMDRPWPRYRSSGAPYSGLPACNCSLRSLVSGPAGLGDFGDSR